jgi:AraC-like DNA-binding protein
MDKPEILLINLNQRDSDSEVMRLLGHDCQITCITDTEVIAETIARATPQVLCFEYDYPDIPRLAALQETKLEFPSLPVVMVSRQHSEDLAVWAFRSRVWDYFVKPLSTTGILECFRAIQALPRKQQEFAPREFAIRHCALPTDTRFRDQDSVRESRIVRTAIAYVENKLHDRISQSEVAGSCGISSSQFSRIFKRNHGTTFQEYVLRRRMGQAVRLLQNPSASITDVCFTVGFNDQSHFTRLFRRYVGVSPSAYRENLNTATASLLPRAAAR